MEEVKMWVIEGAQVAPLAPAGRMENERLLEETLVKSPDLLMEGVTLVGRQTPTDGGALDLLGVDDEGRLVVFELKRGTLSRDAVAQVIDYASYLDAMDVTDLAEYISERSGAHGIDKIEDFQGWYGQAFEELESLKPLRMFLVGLGADDRTERMVNFLANNSNMDISLLTFHGFDYNGKIILAKHVEIEGAEDFDPRPMKRKLSRAERWNLLLGLARDRGVHTLFETVTNMFRDLLLGSVVAVQMNKVTYYMTDPESGTGRAYASVSIYNKGIHIGFYPRAFELCQTEFDEIKAQPSFTKKGVGKRECHGLVLTSDGDSEEHIEKLTEFTRKIYGAWLNKTRGDSV